MGLNARPVIHPRWREVARKPAESMETALIRIIDPSSGEATSERLDIRAGKGGNRGQKATQLWPKTDPERTEGPAWVEVIGGNVQNSSNPATGEAELIIHIDIQKFGPTDAIKFGHQILIVDGAMDKRMNGKVANIKRIATGSINLQRVIYAELPEGF